MTLVTSNLTFGYRKGQPALRGVVCAFEPGAITAIIGPNGAGKTTLLRLLAGLLRPWEGAVTLGGADVARMGAKARAARIAYASQRPAAQRSFSCAQIVRMGRLALGPDEDAIQRAMRTLEVDSLGDEPFGALSAGQQQRVSLARALAQLGAGGVGGVGGVGGASGSNALRGKVLLADEPLTALDPRHAIKAAEALRAAADAGACVVAVLHDLSAALRCADSALALDAEGAVAATGPVESVVEPRRLEALFGVPFRIIADADDRAVAPRTD